MIQIENVSMTFKAKTGAEFKALDGITIEIPDGSAYGFLGSNGAGKSTLMRMMTGIYPVREGSIRIDGLDVFDNPEAKKNIFFVNDETVQYTSYTLDGLKNYYKVYYPDFSDTVFERILEKLHLPRDKRLSEFSKGMKRQAMVLIGLSCRTKYLMLDEAFDGLDPAMRKYVKNIITDEILDREATLIVSSHNIAEISEICDKAMLIHKGRLIFANDVDDIRSGFGKVQLVRSSRPVTPEELEALGLGVVKYELVGSVVQAVIRADDIKLKEELPKLGCEVCETIGLTLEEIFIYEMEARGYATDELA
ncbi:MAG: ABC transporter ATP-binding protein [Ruminococcus sp.]|nr:ABC transporter ATP-binding protein [Ruminococcus sp.]